MPTFKIIQSMEDIRLSNRWSDSEVSENEDKHFNARGRIVNDNYDGPRYQVISEKQRALSLLERSGHIFLGSAAVICSLGLAYFSRSIRNRFIKNKKTIYFAMPLEGINTAKFAAQKFIQLFGTEALQHINTTDQRILFELAKLVAQRDGKRISEEIENYGIIKEEDRVEVAKFAAQQNGEEPLNTLKTMIL
ncbi:hypothetical protein [Candidatus Rhabdochlamydia sp. T3358]|uniref:hypothetical protein n=1 Tax=Candidatus Rhabdochlamydia sp. T3358 TaxID=2099795 RepID=UPI0010B91733|nr:hypothetical protein [Candidatus Rhabdochlamydia sp. T3358]VHO02609.1 hypothetical protein RHT_00545 [Candidatus Rhabdochlamydia sp. T3358]